MPAPSRRTHRPRCGTRGLREDPCGGCGFPMKTPVGVKVRGLLPARSCGIVPCGGGLFPSCPRVVSGATSRARFPPPPLARVAQGPGARSGSLQSVHFSVFGAGQWRVVRARSGFVMEPWRSHGKAWSLLPAPLPSRFSADLLAIGCGHSAQASLSSPCRALPAPMPDRLLGVLPAVGCGHSHAKPASLSAAHTAFSSPWTGSLMSVAVAPCHAFSGSAAAFQSFGLRAPALLPDGVLRSVGPAECPTCGWRAQLGLSTCGWTWLNCGRRQWRPPLLASGLPHPRCCCQQTACRPASGPTTKPSSKR